MTEQNQEQAEAPTESKKGKFSDSSWGEFWNSVKPEGGAEAPAESETVAKSDTSAGQADSDALQGGSEETPAAFDPVKLANAMDEIRRAGLEPSAFKGKSEGELLALGVELETRRRQRDREWQAAQGQSSESVASGQQQGGEARTGDATATAATEAQSPDLDAALTPFVEEFGEAADPVVTLLKALHADNAALKSQLQAEARARQLAPLEKVIEEELAGNEVLSNPDKRDAFLKMAQAKAELDGLSDTDPVELMRKAIRNALPSEAASAQTAKVKTPPPASGDTSRSTYEPKTKAESRSLAFDKWWRETYSGN